ncbi:ROK family protein [Bifidobacterium catulorum]|uniref:ROK family protein n=1 Tax=Bifidobacterium catulorum TaxID=1630173 RepID=A0A2U2MSS0_9BIFI|nr:ROK family protein [Bifidobacterium catulorum]
MPAKRNAMKSTPQHANIANVPLARIVQLVQRNEANNRPALEQATGLGRTAARQRIDTALRLGLIEESGSGKSTGGRTPRLLRFRSGAALLALCAISQTYAVVGISDLDGTIIDRRRLDNSIFTDPDIALNRMVDAISDMTHDRDLPLWAVGVGVTGIIDFATGTVISPPVMPEWHDVNVRSPLESRLHAPVWVDNDVNLLAVEAQRTLTNENTDNLVYLKIGQGIGAGLIVNGAIHRGADGAAGDIGHVAVPGSNVPCRCGKTGCLEAVAAGWGMTAQAVESSDDSPYLQQCIADHGEPTLADLFSPAGAADHVVGRILRTSADAIGETLSSIINLLNPSLVVIGGEGITIGEAYLARLRECVYRRSLPPTTRNLRIVATTETVTDNLEGAANLIRRQLFGDELPNWIDDGTPVDYMLASHAR